MNVLRALAAVTTVLALVGAVPSESLSQTSSALSGRIVKFELHPSFDVRKTAIRETKQPWQRMWASDFTGDGCADLLTADEKGPLSLRISQCGNEFASPILLEQVLENAEERPVAAEINNDLCADLLFVEKDKIVSTFGDCRGKFEARGTHAAPWPLLSGEAAAGLVEPTGENFLIVGSSETHDVQLFPLPADGRLPGGWPSLVAPRNVFLRFADFDGDAINEIVTFNRGYADYRGKSPDMFGAVHTEIPWRAQFTYYRYRPFFGDFNGDGMDDVLAYGGAIAGWWIAQSNGATGLEAPVTVPFSLALADAVGTSGDFDGDGIDELLFCTKAGEVRCEIASMRQVGLEGASVSSGEVKVTSDASGRYAFSRQNAGATLSATKAGWRLTGAQRVRERKDRYYFLAVSEEQLFREKGRVTHYVPVRDGPKVCTGYFPQSAEGASKWGFQIFGCPRHYAWYALDGAPPKPDHPGNAFERGHCCPLPADDILSGKPFKIDLRAALRCPEGSVVIGTARQQDSGGLVTALLCQYINKERYALGPSIEGISFGTGAARFLGDRVALTELPLAIRGGIRRLSYEAYDNNGCIGTIPGALYVGTTGQEGCDAHIFQELFERSTQKKVAMFPDCALAPDLRSPITGCR